MCAVLRLIVIVSIPLLALAQQGPDPVLVDGAFSELIDVIEERNPREENCRFARSIGYVADHNDCTKYFQCNLARSGQISPFLKSCPPGLFWNQIAMTCVRPPRADCAADKCIFSETGYYLDDNHCGSYWVCRGQATAEMRCCPPGNSFSLYLRECEPSTCSEPCPLKIQKTSSVIRQCTKFALYTNPNIYLEQPPGFPSPLKMHCPKGLGFNNRTCSCDLRIKTPVVEPKCIPEVYLPLDRTVRDESGKRTYLSHERVSIVTTEAPEGTIGSGCAFFNRSSFISIPRYSNAYLGETLKITFRYYPLEVKNYDSRMEALVSNSACDFDSTVTVAFDRQNDGTFCSIDTQGIGNQGNLLPASMKTSSWRDVTYTYDGESLRLEVNSDVDVASAFGPITTTAAALKIGAQCDRYQGFTGFIDEVRIWQCFP